MPPQTFQLELDSLNAKIMNIHPPFFAQMIPSTVSLETTLFFSIKCTPDLFVLVRSGCVLVAVRASGDVPHDLDRAPAEIIRDLDQRRGEPGKDHATRPNYQHLESVSL